MAQCNSVERFIYRYTAPSSKTALAQGNIFYIIVFFITFIYKIFVKATVKPKFNKAEKQAEKIGQEENSIDIIFPSTTAPSRVKEFILKSSPQKVII